MKRLMMLGLLICAPVIALAGGGGLPIYSGNSATTAFIGLEMDLTDFQPQLTGGVRFAHSDKGNAVTGAKLDVALPFMISKSGAPTFRLLGLFGHSDLQGEAGIGYDFQIDQPVLAIGAQGPYLNGGANYDFSNRVKPYIGINSLDAAPKRHVTIPVVC